MTRGQAPTPQATMDTQVSSLTAKNRMSHPQRAILLAALASAFLLAACGDDRKPPAARTSDTAPADAITKVTEEGPVKATVKVWPIAPALGDPIHLELTIEAQPGVMVAAPFESERLGRFTVAGWRHDTSRRDDGSAVEVQHYSLQAPGSGKHRIPPIRLEVTDGRGALAGATPGAPGADGDAGVAPPAAEASSGPRELLTEEVPLSVAMVDAARASQELSGPRGSLDASTRDDRPIWLAAIVAALVALGVGGWVGVRGVRRARDRRARVSAYEHAVRRLGELEQRGAPDDAAVDAWFVELSAVVRHYLEGRYQVRAPELTTEEFLQEARRAAGLSAEHRDLLIAFLERCDRVKFAGYRPDAEESLATLKAARAFVEDTRLRLQEGL